MSSFGDLSSREVGEREDCVRRAALCQALARYLCSTSLLYREGNSSGRWSHLPGATELLQPRLHPTPSGGHPRTPRHGWQLPGLEGSSLCSSLPSAASPQHSCHVGSTHPVPGACEAGAHSIDRKPETQTGEVTRPRSHPKSVMEADLIPGLIPSLRSYLLHAWQRSPSFDIVQAHSPCASRGHTNLCCE